MARILVDRAIAPRLTEPALLDAIRLGCEPELIEILLGDDANLKLSGPIRRAAYRTALRYGHRAATELLHRRGANDADVTLVDRVIAACVAEDGRSCAVCLRDHCTRGTRWETPTTEWRAGQFEAAATRSCSCSSKQGSIPMLPTTTATLPPIWPFTPGPLKCSRRCSGLVRTSMRATSRPRRPWSARSRYRMPRRAKGSPGACSLPGRAHAHGNGIEDRDQRT